MDQKLYCKEIIIYIALIITIIIEELVAGVIKRFLAEVYSLQNEVKVGVRNEFILLCFLKSLSNVSLHFNLLGYEANEDRFKADFS